MTLPPIRFWYNSRTTSRSAPKIRALEEVTHLSIKSGKNGAGRLTALKDPTAKAVVDPVEYDADGPNARGLARVYFLHCPDTRRIKIGWSLRYEARIKEVWQYHKVLPVVLIGTINGDRRMERVMHERFAEHRVAGEWFHDTILDDVLELIADDIAFYGPEANVA